MANTAAIDLFWSHPSTLRSSSSSCSSHQTHFCCHPLVLCLSRSQRNRHFVSHSFSASLSSDSVYHPTCAAEECHATRMERLWQEVFSDPSQWWDNGLRKNNPKAPDFKHKTTKEAQWISPAWLQSELAALNQGRAQSSSSASEISGQATRIEQLWQEFFLDPAQWWDKRFDKVKVSESASIHLKA